MDDARKGRAAIKETKEGEIKEREHESAMRVYSTVEVSPLQFF